MLSNLVENHSNVSIMNLIHKVEMSLKYGQVNTALHSIHNFVEKIITEPLCVSQCLGSFEIDELCLKIGRDSFSKLHLTQQDIWPFRGNRPRVIYVVSRLQRSGGHTRLIRDFINAQPEKDHLVISTGVGGPTDVDYFAKIFTETSNARILISPRINFQRRLTWLQHTLILCQPEHIHLLNHHQDSVAVAALVPELGLEGTFYHHGDHHFCLGVYSRHLTHVDLHPMGYHYCRDELAIDNRYLPLTFEDNSVSETEPIYLSSENLITATAAGFNKLEIPYYVRYIDIVPQILKATGGYHIHIGKLTPWALYSLRKKMKVAGIPGNRLIYIEWTPSVWKTLKRYRVDVYMASFPYGAGLTLIEAMGAGVPVIIHQHMYSRVLSSLELAYPEAFSWSNPDALLSHLESLTPQKLIVEQGISRRQYEKYHRPEILQAYFQGDKLMQLDIPSLSTKFRPRPDEWIAWIENQVNLPRLIYRCFHRFFRRMRRIFS